MRTSAGEFGKVLLLTFSSALMGTGESMALEEPKYTVLEQAELFELRQYEPYIVAETLVEGNFADVGNEGFRRLARYIFGNNRKQASIDMTAPVGQESTSEKISMTAPVNQEYRGGKWRITFTMPSEYSMETLPRPLDSRVELKHEPGRLIAALRYSGIWSRERYEEKKARLMSLVEERGLRIVGNPIFARYNSPFAPWFLRRNEVLIPVIRPQK